MICRASHSSLPGVSFVAASDAFAVGEVFSADVDCVSKYASAVGGILSYPLFFAIRDG